METMKDKWTDKLNNMDIEIEMIGSIWDQETLMKAADFGSIDCSMPGEHFHKTVIMSTCPCNTRNLHVAYIPEGRYLELACSICGKTVACVKVVK